MWLLIVIAIIVGIGVLFGLALAIPVDAVFDLDVHGKPRLKVRMAWLFGLVSFDVVGKKGASEKAKQPPRSRKKRAKPKKKTGRSDARSQFEMVLKILRTKGLFREIRNLIIRLYHSVDIKRAEGEFTIGLFDPADTGFLFGVIAAFTIPFGQPLAEKIRLQPAYDRAVFEGEAHGAVRVSPIHIVTTIMLFILSPAVLRVLWILISTRRRKRQSTQSARYLATA